jgi:hypothetical protein
MVSLISEYVANVDGLALRILAVRILGLGKTRVYRFYSELYGLAENKNAAGFMTKISFYPRSPMERLRFMVLDY